MKNNRLNRIEAIVAQSRRNKILRRAIALLSVFVLLLTTNTLKFRADTLERIPTCGFGDHVHTEACYDASGMLVCELHEHTDACYQQRPAPEPDVDDAVESGVEGMDFAEVENDVDSEGELTLKEIAERSGVVTEAEEPEFEGVEVESEPVEYVYELGAQGPVKLSEIIEAVGLPVDFRAIEAVGPVEDTDEAVGLVGIDVVDGDYLIYALRDFPEAELAVITADNMYVVKLAYGIAPMPEPEEKVEEPVETVEETPENTETVEEIGRETEKEIEETVENVEEDAEKTDEIIEENAEGAVEDDKIVEDDAEKTEETEEIEEESEETEEEKEKTEETKEETAETEEESEETKEETEEETEETEEEKEESEETEEETAETEEETEETEKADEADATEGDEGEEADEAEDTTDEPRALAAYFAEIDLSGAEVPLSLDAMMAAATPVEAPEAVEVEVDAEEDAGEASEETSEEAPVVDTAEWKIEYDAELLAVEPIDGDYLVTPLASFEETTVTVTIDDAVYTLTLRDWITPEAEEIAMPPQEFEAEANGVRVSVVAPEGAFPEKTTMRVADVDDTDTLDSIAGTVEGEDVAVKRVHAVDITFYDAEGNEIEPMAPISVVMAVAEAETYQEAVVVHVDNEGNTEVVEQDETETDGEDAGEETKVAFTSDAFSVYAVVLTQSLETRVITADGETYRISVSYGPEAKIPEGATLSAVEIVGEESDYDDYLTTAQAMLPSGESIEVARFFDITILSNGEAVQPAAPVEVKVELEEPAEENVHAIHFADSGEAQVLEAGIEDEAVTFSAEGFSVYGVVYTVDFHYEVNGQTFDFSLPGGSFASFRELMGVLGIAQDDPETTDVNELQAFVDDVESVEFSNPELLSVSKVDADTTVGAVKDGLGLVCEYSDDLTEEDIEAINATGITAVDWALISLKPFASEETLTVTMKNGDSFTIQVTDGQIHTYVISDSGDTYKITVTYDDATGIPADAELRVRQLTPEDERYQDDIDRSNAALLARYDQEATNPVVFDIKIFANDEEIEPIEGTQVSVEVTLALDAMHGEAQGEDVEVAEDSEAAEDGEAAEEAAPEEAGFILIDGVEYTLEPAEVDPTTARVVHLTDDGEAEIVEDMRSMVDADNNLVLNFETESFSDYLFADGNDNHQLYDLPNTIYVGDEIYMWHEANYWVSNIGSVVTETKHNNSDDFKTVRAINTGTFRIYNRYNQNEYREINVLPARTGTTPPATINTVDNATIGLTLNLFDYDLDGSLDSYFNNYAHNDNPVSAVFLNENNSINNGNALKFWGSGIGNNHGKLNQYEQNGVTQIVNNTLTNGYPTVRSDAGGSGNRDLTYLFRPSNGTDKTAYTNVNNLFKKDGDYYVYDSNQNYAWYNPSTNKFEVYERTYYQHSGGENGGFHTPNKKAIGFFPFHRWDEDYDLYVNWNKNLNHHFGMSMSVDFSLPKDPKAVTDTNGDPIIFEFSGDDDLWVFIDGKLAMDIGGIHQPTSGSINFTNHTVTVNNSRQMDTTQFNNLFSNLYDGEKHTLQVFYIERGGCDSNCKIMFNLTQYGDIHFDKVDKDNPNEKLAGAVFGIYKNEACTEPLMENLKNGSSRAYVAESDADGHVQFSDIPLGTYYLKELHAPEGYPVDDTVYVVNVFIDQSTGQVQVKVTIDDVDVAAGVKILNKKPAPIYLGLKKEWQNADGGSIDAPDGVTATFEIKRIRTYETYTEQVIEGEGREVSHLTVGWIHDEQTHVYKEYDLIAGSTATISWSYVDGYNGSKDCIVNGTRIDKDYVTGNVVSDAIDMPAANGSATFYIVDESDNGEAIKGINVAGSQYYGNSGGGVIHTFKTITEPDPDFHYTGAYVTNNNQVTLPIDENTWQYTFNNLPTFGRGNVDVDGVSHEVAFNYSYFLEEVSSTAPEGTTVIYKDLNGNVINSPTDAETHTSGTQTITNKVPFGYLQIKKEVTYNGSDQNLTAEQKSKLAGEYKFKIYTKDDCMDADAVQDPNAAADATDKDLIITITIDADGQAVSSDAIKLLVGNYWIKEVESSNPAMFPVENPIAVTVTKDNNTTSSPVIKTLTNNYDENNGPDKIAIDIEKEFQGLDASSQVPPHFQVLLQYTVGGQTRTVTLHNATVTGENGEKITFSHSEDEFTWHWRVTNIPSEATNFQIKEENYDEAKGYKWKSATLNGTDITSTVEGWHDLTVTAPAATLSNVTNERRTSDSGSNTTFYLLEDDDILLTKLTAHQGTLVISKKPLNLAERDAVERGWPQQGGFPLPPHYFSIEEHPEGFAYGDKTVTFGTYNGETTVKFTQNASAQETVYAVSYSSQDARNNANLVNIYEEIPITIEIVKVDKDNNEIKLPGAVFTLRQLADEEPGQNGNLTTLTGTTPTDSQPTDEDGKTSFDNLTHGYYEVTETIAPTGYILTDGTTFYFKIDSGVVTWLQKGTGKPSTWEAQESADLVSFEGAHAAVTADPEHEVEEQPATNAVFTVENTPGAALPHTGGPGTWAYTLSGLALMAFAVVMLLRRERERDVR